MNAISGERTRQTLRGWDFKWVLAAQAGYELAFDELVSRNKRRVHRVAVAVSQRRADAETIVFVTFCEARERLQEVRRSSRFSSWVLGIAATEALRKLHDEHADGPASNQCTDQGSVPGCDCVGARDAELGKRYTRNELKQILSGGLGVLRPLCRAIFVLRDLEHCSPEEVANSLGLSMSAVRSSLVRSRMEIHKRLSGSFNRESHRVAACIASAESGRKEFCDGKTVSHVGA